VRVKKREKGKYFSIKDSGCTDSTRPIKRGKGGVVMSEQEGKKEKEKKAGVRATGRGGGKKKGGFYQTSSEKQTANGKGETSGEIGPRRLKTKEEGRERGKKIDLRGHWERRGKKLVRLCQKGARVSSGKKGKGGGGVFPPGGKKEGEKKKRRGATLFMG